MKARTSTRPSCHDSHSWRVVDDLTHDCPVTPAELDAVEAFLMPLVHALLADAARAGASVCAVLGTAAAIHCGACELTSAAPKLATRRLVADAAVEPGAQDVELRLAHGAFQPEQEPVVE